MEKRDIIQSITNEMTLSLTKIQIDKLKDVLYAKFENIELTEITDELKKLNEKETNIVVKYIDYYRWFDKKYNKHKLETGENI